MTTTPPLALQTLAHSVSSWQLTQVKCCIIGLLEIMLHASILVYIINIIIVPLWSSHKFLARHTSS